MSVSSTLRPAGQLDELLKTRGLITDEQLEQAKHHASQRGRSIGRTLIETRAS